MDPRTRCVLVHYANIALRHADVWRALEKPVWVHVHGHDIAFGATHDDDPERAICPPGYAERVCALAAHVRFIANSQDSLERLCAIGVPRDRVVLKYLGVPELAPRAEPAPAPDGGLNFLFLGRLVEWKGPHFVVRAWARYRRAGGRGRLWVAGDGPLREECRAIASAEGVEDDIRWLGAVDAAQGASLREDAHVFVVHNNEGRRTRRVEALGVAILEAMAAGLPVLSGRSGGVGETVAHGETGLLCAPGDIDEQAEHMLMLYRDPALRARLREGATERIRRHFSAAAEQATLRQLLGSRDVGSSAQSPAPAVEPQG
jgi:glycosyltransferase involved in cell wall biosynthesis